MYMDNKRISKKMSQENMFLEQEHNYVVSALHHVISNGDADASTNNVAAAHFQDRPLLQHLQAPADDRYDQLPTSGTELPENNSNKKKKNNGGNNKYKGVRQRGTLVWEIWNTHRAQREWLGTFNSAEEAARAYDRKSIEYRGVKAMTNFPLSDYLNVSVQQPSPPPPAGPPSLMVTSDDHQGGGTSSWEELGPDDNIADFWETLLADESLPKSMVLDFPPSPSAAPQKI